MRVATLVETKTGVTHHVRNPSQVLWDIAVRKQKKKGLPDKTRFAVWSRCGTYLRANSLSTSQSITCIACLSQTQEESDAAYWKRDRNSYLWPTPFRFPARGIHATWQNQYLGRWVPYQPKEEVPVAAAKTRQGIVNLNLRERLWIDPDDIVHSGTMHGGMTNVFRTRCGIEVHDASDASLMPDPPTLGCIECILYTGKAR